MATSNVEFYERQRDLQDIVTKSEQERLQLEKQLQLLLKSDQNSAQLKAARLQTYWRKICADEKRAQQRNAMLMREFERIDAHLASTAARTERLQFLKRQYADYVKQTYPEWTQLVEQKIKGATTAQQHQSNQVEKSDKTDGGTRSQEWTEAEKDALPAHVQEQQAQQQAEVTGNLPYATEMPSSQGRTAGKLSLLTSAESNHAQNTGSVGNTGDMTYLSSRKISPSTDGADVSFVRAVAKPQHQPQPKPQPTSPVRQVGTVTQLPSGYSKSDGPSQSQYANVDQYSRTPVESPLKGQGDYRTMEPVSEDELNDFGSGMDIPLSGGDAWSQKVAAEREVHGDNAGPSLADRPVHSSGFLPQQLTINGLIRLLHLIESDFESNKAETEYYGSPILKPEEKENIVQLANTNRDLSRVPALTASHLVLEQISVIVRNLSEKCLIKEEMLRQPPERFVPSDIGKSLSDSAQVLWAAVFAHFVELQTARVMAAKEIAAVFVPCLVADRSQYQDKAYTLLVHLLEAVERDAGDITDASSIASPHRTMSPQHLGGSGSLMEDGKVPPLKFPGSLMDRPFSDDESSFFDQSLPKENAVPLNETSAYQQMLSGTFSSQQQRAPAFSDDTDDDMEKEFASALSPRLSMPVASSSSAKATVHRDPSLGVSSVTSPKSPVFVPTGVKEKRTLGSTGSTQLMRRGLRIGSDVDTDSEMDPRLLGSVKKPDEEKDDFDFYD